MKVLEGVSLSVSLIGRSLKCNGYGSKEVRILMQARRMRTSL